MGNVVASPPLAGRPGLASGAWPRKLLVAIPAYNEARHIGSVVREIRALGPLVIVVDDGSTDATVTVARASGALVRQHPRNLGKAAALNTAFEFARRYGVEVLVLIDGDGQHRVAEIQPLAWAAAPGGVDMAVGSRWLPGSSGSTPYLRGLGQRAITKLVNAASGVDLTDSQSGLRAFSRRAIERLRFESKDLVAESEMQFLAAGLRLRVGEVPISASYPNPPKRSVVVHGARVGLGVLRLIDRHQPAFRPRLPGVLLRMLASGCSAAIVGGCLNARARAVESSLEVAAYLAQGLSFASISVEPPSFPGGPGDIERWLIEPPAGSQRSAPDGPERH